MHQMISQDHGPQAVAMLIASQMLVAQQSQKTLLHRGYRQEVNTLVITAEDMSAGVLIVFRRTVLLGSVELDN